MLVTYFDNEVLMRRCKSVGFDGAVKGGCLSVDPAELDVIFASE
jgi:hypothetical protein